MLGRAVSWKEWYATRLILDGDAGADGGDPEAAAKALREDTALFSKRSGALTDFLSRLPPTCQVGVGVYGNGVGAPLVRSVSSQLTPNPPTPGGPHLFVPTAGPEGVP